MATTACGDDDDDNSSSAGRGGVSSGAGGASSGGKAGASGGASASGGATTLPEVGAGGDQGEPEDVGEGGAGGGAATGGFAAIDASAAVVSLSASGPDRFFGVTYDDAGSIYAVGQIADSVTTGVDVATVVAKFSAKGVLDATFGTGGFVVRNMAVGTNGELFRGITVQSSGKVVVSGSVEHVGSADARDRDLAVARFNADGSNDTTFGDSGILLLDLSTGIVNGTAFLADSAWGLARYDDDRLVVSGGKVRDATGATDSDFVLVRLTADGALDASFGANGVFSLDTQIAGVSNNASPRNVTILPGSDGLIGAGYQPIPGADTGPVVYKVTDAGVLDTTFGTEGVFSDRPLTQQTECYQAVVQPKVGGGYSLVTTGYGRELSAETTDLVSLRLSSDGKLDTTYGAHGVARIDVGGYGDNSRRLVVLPDRRVLLIGGGRLSSANVDGLVAVLSSDGEPDLRFAANGSGFMAFDIGGPADFLWSVALSPDQKTLAAVGIKGVGASPTPATANDDAALLLLPVPE